MDICPPRLRAPHLHVWPGGEGTGFPLFPSAHRDQVAIPLSQEQRPMVHIRGGHTLRQKENMLGSSGKGFVPRVLLPWPAHHDLSPEVWSITALT